VRSYFFRGIIDFDVILFCTLCCQIYERFVAFHAILDYYKEAVLEKRRNLSLSTIHRFRKTFRNLLNVVNLFNDIYAPAFVLWYLTFFFYNVLVINSFIAYGVSGDSTTSIISHLLQVVVTCILFHIFGHYMYKISDLRSDILSTVTKLSTLIPTRREGILNQMELFGEEISSDDGILTCWGFFKFSRNNLPEIYTILINYLFMTYQIQLINR
jgi:hypothetical protein